MKAPNTVIRLRVTFGTAACALLTTAIIVSTTPSRADTAQAILTEAVGKIFKRGFIDSLKQILGMPEPARVNDVLHEGMQMGTGENSWAEINWREAVTRTWSNTVVQIMPNRKLVYLTTGEMLFRLKKDSDQSSDYSIWTKVLQARVHGTTVLVQRSADVTRLSVLEGMVDVTNRIDGSVTRVGPGVVYEVVTPRGQQPQQKDTGEAKTKEFDGLPWEESFEPPRTTGDAVPPSGGTLEWPVDESKLTLPANNICNHNIPSVSTFKTPISASTICIADADAILNHPLLSKFEKRLDSLYLIKNEMSSFPPICFEKPPKKSENPLSDRNRIMGKAVEIEQGPTIGNFKPGSDLGYRYTMPSPIAAGAKSELARPVVTPTNHAYKSPSPVATTQPWGKAGSSDRARQIQDLEQQYLSACNAVEQHKTESKNMCQMLWSRYSQDCSSWTAEECERKKQTICNLEMDAQNRCYQLQSAAAAIKAQLDQLKSQP